MKGKLNSIESFILEVILNYCHDKTDILEIQVLPGFIWHIFNLVPYNDRPCRLSVRSVFTYRLPL